MIGIITQCKCIADDKFIHIWFLCVKNASFQGFRTIKGLPLFMVVVLWQHLLFSTSVMFASVELFLELCFVSQYFLDFVSFFIYSICRGLGFFF
ncbi:MAG: hypothetical protein [Cressdnaviricota sp.]|nr:MAG: hypothetical protein [Cressdnaviricota sp.]